MPVHYPHPGLFVVFEGGEGAGKTSTMKAVAEALTGDVVTTRQPGGTALGTEIRRLLLDPDIEAPSPMAEAVLFAADRAHHVDTTIRPALQRGDTVLCDRYIDSSIAYQAGGRGLDAATIERLSHIATRGLYPDLVFVLDLPPSVGMERVLGRGAAKDRLEQEQMEFHEKVRATFLAAAKRKPAEYVVLDATRPQAEVIADAIAVLTHIIPAKEAEYARAGA